MIVATLKTGGVVVSKVFAKRIDEALTGIASMYVKNAKYNPEKYKIIIATKTGGIGDSKSDINKLTYR